MDKINQWHKTYMEIANTISNMSYCQRKKVGAVLVKQNKIISYGYNGTISGFPNICEVNNITTAFVLHAELNCICKCAKSNQSTKNATIYITLSPCLECAKIIIQSGIKQVIFKELYRVTDGIDLLQKAKIKIIQI